MVQLSWRPILVTLLISGQACCAARPVQGAGLFDWLFGSRSATPDPVVVGYAPMASPHSVHPVMQHQVNFAPSPISTYRVAAPTTNFGRTSCCQSPATSAACCTPSIAYQGPRNMCCPTPTATAPSVPQAYYRTSWKRVPVTRYRPVVSADPITGCPVTVMKPCTTYAWQADRKRCGVLSRLFGQCDQGPAVTACPPNPCVTFQCGTAPSCCGSSPPSMVPNAASPVPATAPYYTPSNAAPVPQFSVPPPTNGSVPSLVPNSSPAVSPQGTEPADRRPSLVPSDGGAAALQPLPSSPLNSDTTVNSDTAAASVRDDGLAGPLLEGPKANTRTILRQQVPLPTFGNPPAGSSSPKHRPVPDPEATRTRAEENPSAPLLLDPRDQVASLPATPAWTATPITWPRKKPTARPTQLDDSGWYSIAK